MKIIFILLVLLIIVDFALNDALIFNEISQLNYPTSLFVYILLGIVCIVLIVLLVYSVIMEWNLLPRLNAKKTLFEIKKDKEKKSEHL